MGMRFPRIVCCLSRIGDDHRRRVVSAGVCGWRVGGRSEKNRKSGKGGKGGQKGDGRGGKRGRSGIDVVDRACAYCIALAVDWDL